MKCRLCLQLLTEKNKCEAHIFPRSLLKAMSAGEFGKLLIVGTDMVKKKRAPSGSYDTNILCKDCDNKIGVYDNYALWFVNNATLENHPIGVGWQVKKVDAHKLKLFCMSYLFRASITERKEFADISLGAKHEEQLRLLILNNNHGKPDDYTVIFARFTPKLVKMLE